MEIDLTPKLAKQVYGGNGGSYHAWCPNELPMLRQGNIGAAKLALEKNGFALPHYCDSARVAYVLQGIIFFFLIWFLISFRIAVWVLFGYFCLLFCVLHGTVS